MVEDSLARGRIHSPQASRCTAGWPPPVIGFSLDFVQKIYFDVHPNPLLHRLPTLRASFTFPARGTPHNSDHHDQSQYPVVDSHGFTTIPPRFSRRQHFHRWSNMLPTPYSTVFLEETSLQKATVFTHTQT